MPVFINKTGMADSEIFRITGGTYLRIVLKEKIGRTKAIAVIAAAIILCVGLGFADIRFCMAGLMILLIVMPGIIAIMILSELLSPEAARGTIPHTAHIDEEKITIHFTGDENHRYKLPPDETLYLADVAEMKRSGEYIVLVTGNGNKKLVILPKEKEGKLPEQLKERLWTFE